MLLNKAKTFDLKKPTKKTVDVEHQNSKQNKNITIRDICSLTKKITCINNENMFNQRSTDTVIKKKSTRSKYRIQSSSSSDDEDVVGVKYNKKTIPLDATTEEIDETCISSHDSLMETQESIVVMERRDIILTAVFGTFGAISIFIGLCLAAWRYLRDKRSKDLISDCDNGIDSENIVSVEESQQYYKKNGLLNFKTPLITSKTVGGTSSPGSKSPAAGSCSPGGGTTMSSGINDAKSPTVAQPAKQTHNVKDNSPKAFLQSRSDSLVDMYIDNTEPSENVGQIHFSLEYDYQNTTLILRIIQGKDLPAKDLSGTSDPYVRVTLLPDKKHRLETKIKRRTLNPRWNETLYFEGFPIQKLQSRVLHLHVFDYDRFSRDDSIGEMFLPLCQVQIKTTFSSLMLSKKPFPPTILARRHLMMLMILKRRLSMSLRALTYLTKLEICWELRNVGKKTTLLISTLILLLAGKKQFQKEWKCLRKRKSWKNFLKRVILT
ncbi:synaptotagmin-4 isoform X6 [Microplitis mediator]|uniref:synaptotagmin-4 isoform X6 n=1 Tax=Microplitis mediator TaxID=375433 RepID=UPI0025543AB3|nr:synaptotagmin-4 isoform X6 [Microplitis mediator]